MTRSRYARKWRFGRARYTFAPVPTCLVGIIMETQARHGVTLARNFAA
jgi:hypothetical protein